MSAPVVATRAQWSVQMPAMLAHRRREEDEETTKRGGSSTTTKTNKKKRVYEHEGTDDHLATEPHRCPPCFASVPNPYVATTQKKSAAAAAAAAAASTPSPQPTPAPSSMAVFSSTPIAPLSKKSMRSLALDYSSFTSGVASQSGRVLSESLPRAVLRLEECEQEFTRAFAAFEASEAERAATNEFHFCNEVTSALGAANGRQGELPSADNATARLQAEGARVRSGGSDSDSDDDDDPPLTSFLQHRPSVRSSLPTLGSAVTQHGWTFHQPSRAHPTHNLHRVWTNRLQSELADFISIAHVLRARFTLSLPSADDANNADTEVVEEILADIRRRTDWATALRVKIRMYGEQRAKLVSKAYKYPGASDYPASISHLDWLILTSIGLNWTQLKHGYMWINQLFTRNEEILGGRGDGDDAGTSAFESML